jgi:hypothetical protein
MAGTLRIVVRPSVDLVRRGAPKVAIPVVSTLRASLDMGDSQFRWRAGCPHFGDSNVGLPNLMCQWAPVWICGGDRRAPRTDTSTYKSLQWVTTPIGRSVLGHQLGHSPKPVPGIANPIVDPSPAGVVDSIPRPVCGQRPCVWPLTTWRARLGHVPADCGDVLGPGRAPAG